MYYIVSTYSGYHLHLKVREFTILGHHALHTTCSFGPEVVVYSDREAAEQVLSAYQRHDTTDVNCIILDETQLPNFVCELDREVAGDPQKPN